MDCKHTLNRTYTELTPKTRPPPGCHGHIIWLTSKYLSIDFSPFVPIFPDLPHIACTVNTSTAGSLEIRYLPVYL